jgi:hypothetical protein
MLCLACRKPLTNEVSQKHGYGPVCLRRAVKAGTAPLEALEQLADWKRSKKRQPTQEQPAIRDTLTMDIFEQPRKDAIGALLKAAEEVRALGVRVQLEIEE